MCRLAAPEQTWPLWSDLSDRLAASSLAAKAAGPRPCHGRRADLANVPPIDVLCPGKPARAPGSPPAPREARPAPGSPRREARGKPAPCLLERFLPWLRRSLRQAGLYFASGGGPAVNDVPIEISSPDGEHRAVVYERNAGATTGFTANMSIVSASADVPESRENVLALDDHPEMAKLNVAWIDAKTLQVKYSSEAKVYHKAGLIDGVTVLSDNSLQGSEPVAPAGGR